MQQPLKYIKGGTHNKNDKPLHKKVHPKVEWTKFFNKRKALKKHKV